MKTLSIRQWIGITALAAVMIATVVVAMLLPQLASANPSQTPPQKSQGSTATTTQSYTTAGTGTTSPITYDSFSTGTDTKFDNINVLVQAHASGTPAALVMVVEDSRDGVDWYARTALSGTAATTTDLYAPLGLRLTLSTSTPLGGTSGTTTATGNVTYRLLRSINVAAPMRYVRVYFYNPVGSGPFAVWAEISPVRQKQ